MRSRPWGRGRFCCMRHWIWMRSTGGCMIKLKLTTGKSRPWRSWRRLEDSEALQAWNRRYLGKKGRADTPAALRARTARGGAAGLRAGGQRGQESHWKRPTRTRARDSAAGRDGRVELERGRARCDAAGPPRRAGPPAHHHADAAPDLRHLCRDGLPGLRGARRGDRRDEL